MVAPGLSLIAIVGPTASGKTGLSIEIAKRYGGEIIAADSRTVYKGLDIGTAKPTMTERGGIVHWGFDLVSPGESFSAADFQHYARAKVREIASRGKLPIIVGGTGLYVDAFLYDYSFAPADMAKRKQLEGLGVIELQQQIAKQGLAMPENNQNRRHLVRTLERAHSQPTKRSLMKGAAIIGLNPDKEVLRGRITKRADMMLAAGVIDEVAWAFKTYGDESEAVTGGIYRVFRDVIRGELPKEDAIKLFVTSDVQLAKRQMTWFRRNPDIQWFGDAETALTWFDKAFGGTLK